MNKFALVLYWDKKGRALGLGVPGRIAHCETLKKAKKLGEKNRQNSKARVMQTDVQGNPGNVVTWHWGPDPANGRGFEFITRHFDNGMVSHCGHHPGCSDCCEPCTQREGSRPSAANLAENSLERHIGFHDPVNLRKKTRFTIMFAWDKTPYVFVDGVMATPLGKNVEVKVVKTIREWAHKKDKGNYDASYGFYKVDDGGSYINWFGEGYYVQPVRREYDLSS